MRKTTKTIRVDYLARVEGEGALIVKVKKGRVSDVKLKIFEPPRFFEAFLRGRGYDEAPDMTARICGICPIAYQMSAVHALENAFGVKVDGQLRALRRLIYCGEWIASHTLHVYMLHAPDFLGYDGAIEMAKDHRQIVERGLQLKKIGNQIMSLIGGREVHPINVKVGGFYRVPSKHELKELAERLKWAREAALETVRWVAKFDFPTYEQEYEFVALNHADEYPFNEGRIVSNKGLDIAPDEFDAHFAEEHIEHSNALHCVLKERGTYFVGPMARYNLNFDNLSPLAKEAAFEAGLSPVCRNPFQSIIVRSVEILYACDEALRLIDEYEMPAQAAVDIEPQASIGFACTEAPRGLLYHRYEIDDAGIILDAKIVPPTSQNQKTIEADLHGFVSEHINLPKPELTWKCEQTVRNYDPCISCATHFLKLDVEQG
ncbi:MAG: Ni/Fe hydrogenase subunit alpha [Acidobacteriota bacterium]|nr:Ni/Fe hydrogenase subunit alpha [Acidobacteriota bacterium]MDH3528353.1 Ni/Fe hydrogenase subunit alpha [Acidobacteriota bacterium]